MSRPVADILAALTAGALFGALCSCTHRVDTASQTHEAVAVVQDTASARETVSHEVDGAGRETITVEEYADGAPQATATEAPAGGVPALQVPQGRESEAGAGVAAGQRSPEAPAGRLIRRTVTVKDFGPVTKDLRVEAQASTETHETAHLDSAATSHTETHAGPSPWLWLAIGAGVVLALALLWHFRAVLL